MERDLNLIRSILLKMETNDDSSQFDDADEQTHYHLKLLQDAGYIELGGDYQQEFTHYIPERITWQGHEFLDLARNDAIWSKAQCMLWQQNLQGSIFALKVLLEKLAMKAVGL